MTCLVTVLAPIWHDNQIITSGQIEMADADADRLFAIDKVSIDSRNGVMEPLPGCCAGHTHTP
jgi:hypothetical protein